MTFVRRFSYLLVILPLLAAGCGRQPLLDDGTGGVGDTPSPDGDNPRGVNPDRSGGGDDGDNDDGDRDGDGDQGRGDDGDSSEDPPTPIRPPMPRPPAPQPDPEQCLDKCATAAKDFSQQCLMRNISKDACSDQRQRYYNECVFSNCGGMSEPDLPAELPQPPDISCEDQCVVGSAAEFIGCVQSGRPLELCAAIAQGDVDGCQRGCNGEDLMSCEADCDRDAADAYNACSASGRPERRCEQIYRNVYRDCSQQCR
jgi:hypothetical protein